MKIDLGCGAHKREGFIGVDISPECGADVVHDLRTTPWPFADSSVDEAYCSHFFEHLTGAQRVDFMAELYRVLKPGALATMITPYWSSMGAMQDPTHQWPPVGEGSYYYFNKAWRDQYGLSHYGIHCDFDLEFSFRLDPALAQRPPQEQQFAARFYVNAVQEMTAVLKRQ
ncbi:class I SAM-dependent methyltransferase [Dokdonella soli]|uniref:Methyltransferase type 11 domain-containing protein n=1 Tax=Dokdonella soli TaxID=529810 RepID=A0ABN1ICV5_9GAMM